MPPWERLPMPCVTYDVYRNCSCANITSDVIPDVRLFSQLNLKKSNVRLWIWSKVSVTHRHQAVEFSLRLQSCNPFLKYSFFSNLNFDFESTSDLLTSHPFHAMWIWPPADEIQFLRKLTKLPLFSQIVYQTELIIYPYGHTWGKNIYKLRPTCR